MHQMYQDKMYSCWIGDYRFERWIYADGAVEYICYNRWDHYAYTSFLYE